MQGDVFTFDAPKGQSNYIKVIGVGGGGGNAVNHMFRQGIQDVDFIVCNTDIKALNSSPVPNKIFLGKLGAGGKPEKARQAALSKEQDIREALSHGTQMLFITAGMGGGTGTGAAPVIAEIAKSIDLEDEENKKILVVAIVTRPFSFEGIPRAQQAEEGIRALREHVDSMIIINNDKLRTFGNLRMSQAFAMSDDVLLTAAKGIAEIITKNAYVNRDFQDINSVMENSGRALMGTGVGKGENRAHDAIVAATTSVLLDDSDITGATNVLIYFTYSDEHELTMDEQGEVATYVVEKTGGTANIVWGMGPDDTLDDELKVIIIATGFGKSKFQDEIDAEPEQVIVLDNNEKPQPVKKEAEPKDIEDPSEPKVIHREPEPEPIVPIQPKVAYVKPVVIVQPEPKVIAKPQPEPEPEPEPTIHVFTLDDDEPKAVTPTPDETQKTQKDVENRMVGDIKLVEKPQPQPEPMHPQAKQVQPQPQPKVPTQPVAKVVNPFSAFRNDNDSENALVRIQRIHDLLRNNPNGAEMVQSITTAQLINEEELYTGRHSSEREAGTSKFSLSGKEIDKQWNSETD